MGNKMEDVEITPNERFLSSIVSKAPLWLLTDSTVLIGTPVNASIFVHLQLSIE